jgi:hypothetical protein
VHVVLAIGSDEDYLVNLLVVLLVAVTVLTVVLVALALVMVEMVSLVPMARKLVTPSRLTLQVRTCILQTGCNPTPSSSCLLPSMI